MKRRQMRITIGLLLLIGCGSWRLAAQCPKNNSELYHLEQAFEAGSFDVILDLRDCVRSLPESVRKRKTKRAHKADVVEISSEALDQNGVERFLHLFAKTAVAADRPELATVAIGQLRILSPRYRPNPEEDPYGMKLASDSIIPFASDLLGISGGPGLTLLQSPDIEPLYYGLDDGSLNPRIPDYRNRPAYFIGFEWQHFFKFHHGFVTGVSHFGPSFATRQIAPGHVWNAPSPGDNDWQILQKEQMRMVQVPLLYQYRLRLAPPKNGVTNWLAFQAGAVGQFLHGAESDYTITKWEIQEGDTLERNHRETLSEVLERRTRWSCALQGSVSLQMETHGFAGYIRLGSQLGLTQMRKRSGAYRESFLTNIWEAHLVDNDFRIHSVQLTLGLMVARGNRIKKLGNP